MYKCYEGKLWSEAEEDFIFTSIHYFFKKRCECGKKLWGVD